MTSGKQERLDEVAKSIQYRWGSNILRTPNSHGMPITPSVISSSYPSLDLALDIGGIPRGHLTEILGTATSGASTLALRIAGSAQAIGDAAAYIDLDYTFDAEYAAHCGVDFTTFLIVRPHDKQEGLLIARDLITKDCVGVIIFNFGMNPLSRHNIDREIRLILPLLASSQTALVLLHTHAQANNIVLSEHSSVRLWAEWDHWIMRRKDVRGWRSKVTVLKNRFGIANRTVSLLMVLSKDIPLLPRFSLGPESHLRGY